MPECARCGAAARRVYDCDHTGYEGYCKECYEDLHHSLT